MKKDNLLLSSDYNEFENQYWYIYDYKTLDVIKTFDSEEEAQKYFDSIVD